MSYIKQNFQDGQVLAAEHMQKLEIGILNSEFCDQENMIKILTISAGDVEGSVPFELTEGSGPYAAVIACSDLAQELFEEGNIGLRIGNHNYGSLASQIKGAFDPVENLPWRQNLEVNKFEYAKGVIEISLIEPAPENLSYICILAKDGSAEAFLGDMIIDTLNPLLNKVNELELRLAIIEEALQ